MLLERILGEGCMVVTEKDIGIKLYGLYNSLRSAGFGEGQTLGIISQTLSHLVMQNILTDLADSKRTMETK